VGDEAALYKVGPFIRGTEEIVMQPMPERRGVLEVLADGVFWRFFLFQFIPICFTTSSSLSNYEN
jgi:hypothetical protein